MAGPLLRRLSGVITSPEELQEYLDDACHAISGAVPGCTAVSVTLMRDGDSRTVGASHVDALSWDDAQYAAGEGPCLEAGREEQEQRASGSAIAARWPLLAQQPGAGSWGSVWALPLLSGDECLGALNLYGAAGALEGDAHGADLRGVARQVATVLHAGVEVIDAREVARQMAEAMSSRAVIEQAKGVLMAVNQVDDPDAFQLLRVTSQRRNIKVRELAAHVVAAAREGRLEGWENGPR